MNTSPSTFDLPTTVPGSLYTASGHERTNGPWLPPLLMLVALLMMYVAPCLVLSSPAMQLVDWMRDIDDGLGFALFSVFLLGSMLGGLLLSLLPLVFFAEEVRIDGEGVHGARQTVRWSEVVGVESRSMVVARDDMGVTTWSPHVLVRTRSGTEFVFAEAHPALDDLVAFCRAQLGKGSAEDVPPALHRAIDAMRSGALTRT